MLPDPVRRLWDEPRAPGAPRRVGRDWLLVAAVTTATLLEGILRSDVVWRPAALALALGLAWTLLWRRTHPLVVVTIVFGALIVLNVVTLATATTSVGLYTMGYVLVLPYALVRWGSGREVVVGMAVVVVAYALGIAADYTTAGEAFAGSIFALSPAVLGALVRFQSTYQSREKDQIKLREREQLARELHDTVAHHVSAIAIRAQAGRVVEASNPGAALEALQVIEDEASRALAEMRLMVRGLRDGAEASLVPQPGIADLERLASPTGRTPRVTVTVSGNLDALQPSVDAAIYRLAQESVTNAVRHARHATQVSVVVEADVDTVRLTVADDGEIGSSAHNALGYGIVGMNERVTILGGSFAAGPGAVRGWTVSALLPRVGEVR